MQVERGARVVLRAEEGDDEVDEADDLLESRAGHELGRRCRL